jgi:hypothetical protein
MNNFIGLGKVITALMLLVFSVNCANAETLHKKVSNLQLIPLNYGTNNLHVTNKNILIIKGRLETGNAWAQDNYIVMSQQQNKWQIVQYNQGKDNIIIRAIPHTGEDSISTVYFMKPKSDDNTNKISELYLLQVSRKYKESPVEFVPAELSLSILNHTNDDMGVLYFHNIQTISSKTKYCNADSAAYHELQIPLPGDGKEFRCLNK